MREGVRDQEREKERESESSGAKTTAGRVRREKERWREGRSERGVRRKSALVARLTVQEVAPI